MSLQVIKTYILKIRYNKIFYFIFAITDSNSDEFDTEDEHDSISMDEHSLESDDDLENICPKYLIFSTGSKTYTPHEIGFKRIDKVDFPKILEPGLSLKERILRKKQRERELEVSLIFI